MLRNAFIFGESYCFIMWNKEKGDLHPLYVKARDMNMQLDFLDESGAPMLDADGNALKIDPNKPIYIGDVDYEVEVPWRVYLTKTETFKRCRVLF